MYIFSSSAFEEDSTLYSAPSGLLTLTEPPMSCRTLGVRNPLWFREGLPNSSLRFSYSSFRGHQLSQPASDINAGTRTVRTINVSNSTDEKSSHAIWLSVSVCEKSRPPNAIAIITPAAVMIPDVSTAARRIDASFE